MRTLLSYDTFNPPAPDFIITYQQVVIAIGEYVPGSQLLVGGKLITSQGLLKRWTGAYIDNYISLRGQYTRCMNEHFYYRITGKLDPCPICYAEPKQNAQNFLLPMHVFSSAAWDPPKMSIEIERVGRTEQATFAFTKNSSADVEQANFAGIAGLTALYRETGELLVYNEGEFKKGFAACLKCGYAESETKYGQGQIKLTKSFKKHAPLTSTDDDPEPRYAKNRT